jgi:ParB-like chromosome segregation protein Spo0J
MDVVSQLVMVATAKVKPYRRNARQNDATVDKLVELIPKVGFNVPLVLDRKNVIVKGHSRWKAAQRLGMKEVPCVYTDADPETVRLDRLADNRVQEFSLWDDEMLSSEVASLNLGFDFDVGALGFKISQPSFDVAPPPAADPATPAAAAAAAASAEPFITPEDVARTIPLSTPAYREVKCPECGEPVYIRKFGA